MHDSAARQLQANVDMTCLLVKPPDRGETSANQLPSDQEASPEDLSAATVASFHTGNMLSTREAGSSVSVFPFALGAISSFKM